VEGAKTLVNAVRRSDRTYFFGENACYGLWAKAWRRLVAEGRIGEPQYMEGEYIHDLSGNFRRDDRYTWRATELDPIRYCTHETGPILDILNDRVALAVGMGTSSKKLPGKPVDDMQVALFKTVKGVTIKELTAFAVNRPHEMHYFSLYGSKGMLETTRSGHHKTIRTLARLDGMEDCEDLMELPLGDSVDTAVPLGGRSESGSIERAMLDDFFACIRDKKPATIDVYRGLDYTLPGIIAVESIKRGSIPLEVPDPRKW